MRSTLALLLLALLGACQDRDPFARAEAAYARADYPTARALYEEALERASADVPRARVHARLGLTLRKLGELPAAETALQAALSEAGGDGAQRAEAQRYLGQVYAARGERDAAMAQYDAALAWHREHGPAADLMKVQMSRAALAWDMDDFSSAYDAYADVLDRARSLGDTALEADALDGVGMLLGHVGEQEAARSYVARAATLHAAAQRTEALARSTLNQANLAVEAGQFADGRALADQAAPVAERSGNKLLQAQVRLVRANAYLGEALYDRALAAADEALGVAGPAGLDEVIDDAWLLRALAAAGLGRGDDVDAARKAIDGRGKLPDRWRGFLEDALAKRSAASGDEAGELDHLRRAVDAFERLRGQFGPEVLASFYSRRRLDIYQDLLRALVGRDRVDEAEALVGRIKARALLDDLVRVRRGDDPADARRMERGAHLRQIAAALPEAPAEPDARRLPADLGVLDYYLLPDELLVFWVTRDERRLFRVPVAAGALAEQVGALERGILGRGRDYEAPAGWLAQRLLDPAAAVLNDGPRRLCVITHGPLHRVPFEVLPWAGDRLLDRFDVFSAPSLPALQALLDAPPPAPAGSVLAVGDAVENLPGARVEASRIGGLFPNRTVLLGDQALETRVRAALGDADVVHLAVHGIEPGPGRPAYLELLPDSRNDGRLFADEIATLHLRSTLVTLSACDSGVGSPNPGDEIPGVLDRAFLQAGARTVISSRWPVSDAAAVPFMQAFYAALPDKGRLAAFSEAQRALRHGRLSPDLDPTTLAMAGRASRGVRRPADDDRPPDFTHPYFWASFALKGDPR
jgi:CHAT domain-containing protein